MSHTLKVNKLIESAGATLLLQRNGLLEIDPMVSTLISSLASELVHQTDAIGTLRSTARKIVEETEITGVKKYAKGNAAYELDRIAREIRQLEI